MLGQWYNIAFKIGIFVAIAHFMRYNTEKC